MTDGHEKRPSPLDEVLSALGLRSVDVISAADRIAAAHGQASVTRQHFYRLRKGRMRAREDTIRIIVAAVRELTGLLIGPSDLFRLELAGAASYPLPGSSPVSWRAVVADGLCT